MLIDSDVERKNRVGIGRDNSRYELGLLGLLSYWLLVILEDVQAKLVVYNPKDFLKVVVIVQVLPFGNEPETVTAFSTITEVHEKISPAGLAVVEVAAGNGVCIERILELYSSNNLVAKIVLEYLQAAVSCPENVILFLQILHHCFIIRA